MAEKDTKAKATETEAEKKTSAAASPPSTVAAAREQKAASDADSKAASDKSEDKPNENSLIKEYDSSESSNPGEINTGVTADEIPASGSISEAAAVADIPVEHPAVDDNPRRGQSADANRIDFNNPGGFRDE